MNITSISDKKYLNYENYIKYPMQTVESKLKMTISKNPHLINSLDRNFKSPSITKYRIMAFENYSMYVLKISDDYDKIVDC